MVLMSRCTTGGCRSCRNSRPVAAWEAALQVRGGENGKGHPRRRRKKNRGGKKGEVQQIESEAEWAPRTSIAMERRRCHGGASL